MRVAYFTDTFYPEINGVTNTLSYLSEYLDQKGIDNIFFAPDYEKPEQNKFKGKAHRFKGVKTLIAPESRLSLPFYPFHKEKIEEFAPDIVHITDQLGIGRLGIKYAQEFSIPIVMSYHTNFDQYLKFHNLQYLDNILWSYTKRFYGKADLTLCPSMDTLNSLKGRGFEKLGIWSRGIDTKTFNPSYRNEETRIKLGGKDKLLFLYVGRISAEKDLDTLLESIKLVNAQLGEQVQFVFTGLGPYMSTLEQSGIKNIVLTGAKKGKELSEIYASCDAFVFPSGTETFGNVLLEAMASGLPTLCVNSGGVLDFAKDYENSIICENQNARSIADGIITLAQNSMLRGIIAKGALATAEQRSWNSIFNKLINDYLGVLLKHKQVAV